MQDVVCFLCFLLGTPNPAASDVSALVKRLEARYRSARTLQATFLERYSENGKLVRSEAGVAYFRRPGKMRWEYEAPEKNLFLVDGKTAWFYVPADRTVTRVPAKESADWRTPLALLAGEMRVSRVCRRVEYAADAEPQSATDAMLHCELRGTDSEARKGKESDGNAETTGNRETVYLEVVQNSGDLVRILIKDPGGVAIEFRFANWQTDPPVNDSLFRFQVPRGVAIVNGELPSGERAVNP